MKFDVEVAIRSGYFVEAAHHQDACDKAIALAKSGVRPAYELDTIADSVVAYEPKEKVSV